MRSKPLRTVSDLTLVAEAGLRGGYARPEVTPSGITRPRVIRLEQFHDCENPYTFEMFANSEWSAPYRARKEAPVTVYGTARCRRCPACKRRRAMDWRERATVEFYRWPVSLFGTFTMSPAEHYKLDAEIAARLQLKGVSFNALNAAERLRARATCFGEHLDNFLMRIRWGRDKRLRRLEHGPVRRPRMRYLLVCEAHDSERTSMEMRGRPHYHILIHICDASGGLVVGDPLQALLTGSNGEFVRRMIKTKKGWRPAAFLRDDAFIRQEWNLGFTKFQWCENAKTATYLTKYLTKSLEDRVRASRGYGAGPAEAPRPIPEWRTKGVSPVGETCGFDPPNPSTETSCVDGS